MIIGDNKEAVINNIKQAIIDGDFNRKVEIKDPKLTDEEQKRITSSCER